MKFRRKQKDLNGKTPGWFKDWHSDYFRPADARSKRNEKWLYIIITAIIGTSLLGGSNEAETVLRQLLRLFNS